MKKLIKTLITVAALAASPMLLAQAWPNKPIRLIVPFPPGGAADIIARAYAVKLTDALGQPVVLDNRPGADTIIGMETTARAQPDGYTLILAINSALSMNPALYSKLPYDGNRDFAPIAMVASAPLALVVPPTSPAKTAAELGAMMKAEPGKYSYGSGNMVARVGAEALLSATGGKAVPIMYKGSAPTIVDLMRGEVQFAFEPAVVVMPHVKAGKMRALGVASSKRSPAAPDVPTLAETGMAGFDIPVWFGFMAPAGTPRPIVNQLQAELAKAAQSPDVKDKLAGIGVEVLSSSPEQFTTAMNAERDVWVKRIREWGLKVD